MGDMFHASTIFLEYMLNLFQSGWADFADRIVMSGPHQVSKAVDAPVVEPKPFYKVELAFCKVELAFSHRYDFQKVHVGQIKDTIFFEIWKLKLFK